MKLSPMKKLYSTAIMIFMFSITNAQTTFQKLYSAGSITFLGEVTPTSDGGYILCGYTGTSSYDYLVSKLDASGQIQWARHLGSWMGNEIGVKIGESLSGGYYLLGSSSSDPNSGLNLISLDVSGNILWNKTYDGGSNAYLYNPSMRQIPSGDFILSATVYDTSGMYFLMLKTDSSGNLLWSKAYGAMNWDKEECYDIELCNDGGFIMVGDAEDTGIYVVKTDSNGNLMWTKKYATSSSDYIPGYAISKTSDGGYIISGMIYEISAPAYYVALTKIDGLGNFLWGKKYTNAASDIYISYSLVQTPDSGFAIVTSNGYYPYLIKLNSSGKSQIGRASCRERV